ncbi:MAG: amidohydrolase family protein [Candidatus Coatesbacteria bacterium]|nr:amidohydrolase family protein [Candidatus Coatesbacteria bacterium]
MKASSLLLRGGRVIDPANGLDAVRDVLISSGVIAGVGENMKPEGAEILDCAGKLVLPGLVDTNVHLNEPGREDRETIATGTRAAARGGYTAVACRSTENMVMDNQTVVQFIRSRAERDAVVRVFPVGTLTRAMAGEALAEIGELTAAGALAVCDDIHPVADAAVMRRVIGYAKMFNIPVLSFPEDPELAAGGVMHEGPVSTRLGLEGIPAVAEEVFAAREIILSAALDYPIHLSPVSCADTVELLRYARSRGVAVTAEVTPHNLLLTDEACADYDTNAKVSPPLRSTADREALVAALADGTLEVVASDHSPCTTAEKLAEFDRAACGISGLETAFPLLFTELVLPGRVPAGRLVDAMSRAPARVLGLALGALTEGYPADVTIIDPETPRTVDPRDFDSKGRNTPFAGRTLRGWPCDVLVGGRFVLRGGELND